MIQHDRLKSTTAIIFLISTVEKNIARSDLLKRNDQQLMIRLILIFRFSHLSFFLENEICWNAFT